jgi:hypothetical protein
MGIASDLNLEILARMASRAYQEAHIDRSTKDAYVLPDELLDMLLGELRRCILRTGHPLKERVLDLYVYCRQESGLLPKGDCYGSEHWENIRVAVANFLTHLAVFDLAAWEKREIGRSGS